jgi:four helix bundle protein
MKDFRRLQVWEKAHALTLAVYLATEPFPKSEMYGLTSQLRRACVSIGSNIVEGAGRSSDRELARFLDIAGGSANEVEYQLLLARDLGYLKIETHASLNDMTNEVKRMINAFTRRIRQTAPAPR